MPHRKRVTAAILCWLLSLLSAEQAKAIDEIKVYNGEIAERGQWTLQQHLNYTHAGRKDADFPGGLVPNRSTNGTPELAYGLTDWWEVGFYAPFAVNTSDQSLSNGAKIRNLFVVPDAAKRSFFYGVNFELSYQTQPFSQTRYAMEIRPIVGVRNAQWEFIVNPIVDIGFGALGEADFTPAARLVRNLGGDRFIGIEYYADMGKIGAFLPLKEQSQQLFGVADFKIGQLDVELGLGYGLTSASDRVVSKIIFGYAFPVEGGSPASHMAMATRRQPSSGPIGSEFFR